MCIVWRQYTTHKTAQQEGGVRLGDLGNNLINGTLDFENAPPSHINKQYVVDWSQFPPRMLSKCVVKGFRQTDLTAVFSLNTVRLVHVKGIE